jgi:hypothetical protein
MKLVNLCWLVAAAITTMTSVSAQESRHRLGDPIPREGTADLSITRAPNQIPSSLKDLTNKAVAIVYGSINSVLPARETSPAALETDAIVDVKTIFKGKQSDRSIVISQRGGSLGKLFVTPKQYCLVRPGEEYLLFLVEDPRPNIPAVAGLKRYLVAGLWTGLLRFENGRLQPRSGRVPDRLWNEQAGRTLDQVIGDVRQSLLEAGVQQ